MQKNNKELFNYSYTPEVLGLDEAHIDEHYRLIITDIKEQHLIDMNDYIRHHYLFPL